MLFQPNKNTEVWKMYKQMVSVFWVSEEIDLSQDRFDELAPNQQLVLTRVLQFFAIADSMILQNIETNMKTDWPFDEVSAGYSFIEHMETVHSEVYMLLLEKYNREVIQDIETAGFLKEKQRFAERYMSPAVSRSIRLVAFCAIEGLFFLNSFAIIFYLKRTNLLPGLQFSNQLISRDEQLHVKFAAAILKRYGELDTSLVRKIVLEACCVEKRFVLDAFSVPLPGLRLESLIKYTEFSTDVLLAELGLPPFFHLANNPLDFMVQISLKTKANFFERKVSEYQKANISSVLSFDDPNF